MATRKSARERQAAIGSSSSSRQTWSRCASSCSSAAPASRSGKTTLAHAGVGQGAIVQFVVRSLTTLPASLSDGKRSRPTRAGSRSSSRPGATGPERPTRAAPTSPRASRRLPCQSGMKSRSSSRACSMRARLTHGIEVLDVDELGAVAVGARGDGADHELLARLAGDRDDLAGLHVGAESDDDVGEALEGGVVHAPRLYAADAKCAVSLNERSSQWPPGSTTSRDSRGVLVVHERERPALRWPAGRPRR